MKIGDLVLGTPRCSNKLKAGVIIALSSPVFEGDRLATIMFSGDTKPDKLMTSELRKGNT